MARVIDLHQRTSLDFLPYIIWPISLFSVMLKQAINFNSLHCYDNPSFLSIPIHYPLDIKD